MAGGKEEFELSRHQKMALGDTLDQFRWFGRTTKNSGPSGNTVGDYRIIADIQDAALCVLVVKIGNRRDVYR